MCLAAVIRPDPPDPPAPQGQECLAQGLNVFRVVHTALLEVFAPKGLEDSAQGFNPGDPQNKRFALKGRQDTR
jgi:hypothetical protein